MRSAWVVLGLWGCGERPARQQAALVPAVLDAEGAWPGVGQVTTGRRASCSGTLVYAEGDAGFVLTAAHCVFDIFNEHGYYGATPRGFRFGPAQDIEVDIGRVAVHPSYGWDRSVRPHDPWPLASANDVAVFEVRGLPAEAADWVIPIWDGHPTDLAVGEAVTLVGFGGPQLGLRQVAPARVGLVGNMPVHGASFLRVFARDGSVTCPGDSGGPVVLDTPEGPRVVGVHSSGVPDCMRADADSTASGAREAQELMDSIRTRNRPPAPTTCPACAGTSGACGETRMALINQSAARLEDCINQRTPEGNFASCSEQFPAIRAAYDAHWACLQDTCGAGVCTDASRVITLCEYSHDGAGPCDACIVERCCKRASTCVNDPVCRACANTTEPDAACRGNASLVALYECLSGRCEAECGPYVGEVAARVLPPADAGLPDAGLPDAAAPDAAEPDVPDAAIDAAVPDAAPDPMPPAAEDGDDGCQARPGPGSAWLLALGLLLRRRRACPTACRAES